MLIHEITEKNFLEERKKGQIELQKKFDKYDKLQEITDQKLLKEKLAEAFKDPTIWAYGTLFDKQLNRLKLLPYQDKFINDKKRFVYVTASNQIGKTYAACVKGIHHALHVPNASVMIISKGEQQAVMVLDEIKWMLKRARIDFTPIIGEIENRTELHINGPNNSVSVLRCFPPTTTALGFPATLQIDDEVNFWEKIGELTPTEYYDQVLEPRTNMTKSWKHDFLTMGQVFFISNPNGKNGIGWRTFSEDKRFNNYRYCWLAYPPNSLEEYQEAKKRLPYFRFSSIYAAEYVSREGGFIDEDQYLKFAEWNHPLVIPPGCLLYLGGDVSGEDVRSKSRDDNVLYGVIQVENTNAPAFPRIRMVYKKEWPAGTKKSVIYAEIKRLTELEGITVAKFAYDKVGVGDKMKNDLVDQGILSEYQIESLTYSLQNKSDVYINFQTLFSLGMIEGRDIFKLREQIMGLEVTRPDGSVHLKIHHRSEGIKDDHPDALANACWVAKRLCGVPVSASFVKSSVELNDEEFICKHRNRHFVNNELTCKDCGEEL